MIESENPPPPNPADIPPMQASAGSFRGPETGAFTGAEAQASAGTFGNSTPLINIRPIPPIQGDYSDDWNQAVQQHERHRRNFVAAVETGPVGSPPDGPPIDAFAQAANDAALNPDPAVERDIFESALRDESETPASGATTSEVRWYNDSGQHVRFVNEKSNTKSAKTRRMRTAIGRSVQANSVTIILSVASLVLLIDDKLASLRDERRNDRDALAEELAHYESVRRDLEALRDVAIEVKRGKADDKAVIKATTTFSEGIRNWWNKKHEEICAKAYDAAFRTYDAALFVSCVGLCSLLGCEGPITVAVSGALIGGKPVIDALKALPSARSTKRPG